MNKEEGNFYTFSESITKTKIKSLFIEESTSLFYIIASSAIPKSEITIVEISETEFNPNCLLSLKIDLILNDALIIKTKSGFLLFAIGYESEDKVGKESVYFSQEIEIKIGQKLDVQIKPVLKSKKINFTSLAQFNDFILLLSNFEIYKYNLNEKKMEVCFESPKKTNQFVYNSIKTDQKNRKIFVGQKNNLNIFDEHLQLSLCIEKTHDNLLTCVDFNVNKNNQILTCANESFLKFWDLRNPSRPNLIVEDYHTLVPHASFNGFYDQLVLYAGMNGSVVIYSANSISSSILLKSNEDKQIPENKKLKVFESALDDFVNSACWSSHDAWIFAAGSVNKCYFDILPQKMKFETMF